jgi:hypothetical protein
MSTDSAAVQINEDGQNQCAYHYLLLTQHRFRPEFLFFLQGTEPIDPRLWTRNTQSLQIGAIRRNWKRIEELNIIRYLLLKIISYTLTIVDKPWLQEYSQTA